VREELWAAHCDGWFVAGVEGDDGEDDGRLVGAPFTLPEDVIHFELLRRGQVDADDFDG